MARTRAGAASGGRVGSRPMVKALVVLALGGRYAALVARDEGAAELTA